MAGPAADAAAAEREAARRARQRELQQQALALRAQGGEYVPSKRKRKTLERRKFEARDSERHAAHNKKRRAAQKKVKKQRAEAPPVVIVPIFWKGEAGQRAKVLSVCADVEKLLGEAGTSTVVDAGKKYTPGQKFAHWEHRGVRLRVEVGPREAARGCCTLARTFEPGEPAKRVSGVGIDADLPRKLDSLRDVKDEESVGDLGGDSIKDGANGSSVVARGSARSSGDQLDDDFVDDTVSDNDDETAPAPRGPKKKKRKGAAEDPPGWDAAGAPSPKAMARKARQVKF